MSAAVPDPGVIELDCRAERQATISWCWAACICGIARFAKADRVPTEGELANLALGRTDCTHSPVPAACVVPAPPIEPVVLLARLGISCVTSGPLPEGALREEIAAGRPVLCGLVFTGGGGHFAIVRGYRGWTGRFVLSDPWFGDADVSYAELASAYGMGHWAFAYGRFARVK